MKLLWMSIVRLFGVLAVVARHASAHFAGLLLSRFKQGTTVSGPERLRRVFEDLGGTFIKFGQMLALQPDILSLEYCDALFNLLDRVAPFSYREVERIIVEELGRRPEELFDSFDAKPLATASIGQVHIAYLNGRKVAVKVQRPTVDVDFKGDIRLMLATIRLIRLVRFKFLYWTIEPMSEFVAWTSEELDYRREARYMHRLRQNASDNSRERVPEVFWEFTTRRTLVAEFLEGETVLSYIRALERAERPVFDRLDATGFDSHRLASNIIDNFLGDVFQHGMFHADLHPANLMILPNNVVGYIDFGITGTISRFSRRNLIALTLAYTRGDIAGMCQSFFRVSAMDSVSSGKRFREGLQRASIDWYAAEGRKRRLRKNFTLVMLDMLKLSRASGVWPERDVIKYIRSAIAIDGLITRLAPGFNLGDYLQAVCERYLKWDVRSSQFNFESFAGSAAAMERLAGDGATRAAGLMRRLASNELPARLELVDSGASGAGRQRRALNLALAAFGLVALISKTMGAARLGINLFTAEALVAAAATGMLLRDITHLLREE